MGLCGGNEGPQGVALGSGWLAPFGAKERRPEVPVCRRANVTGVLDLGSISPYLRSIKGRYCPSTIEIRLIESLLLLDLPKT